MEKLIRRKPTKELIIELSGNNQDFISCLHHGLAECPSLSGFYPWLNLDELIAFAASSWRSRERKSIDLGRDIYEIFKKEFQIGFPWLNKNKRISRKNAPLYDNLNPHEPSTFKDRIYKVKLDIATRLFTELSEHPSEWVFECQYNDRKRLRGGDNYGLEIMGFQNVYPRKGKIIPNFAAEIARIISRYPREYEQYAGERQISDTSQASLF
ncbi:MAG: hypothetical protein K6T16_00760 [Candidatus Pacearchaeota archaeon]|nr:hypothetical protein [Candidatus Pacearchaeota archaeon]